MILTLSYQVYEVLDGEVDGDCSGRVQGFLQEFSYRPQIQNLGSTQHTYQKKRVIICT